MGGGTVKEGTEAGAPVFDGAAGAGGRPSGGAGERPPDPPHVPGVGACAAGLWLAVSGLVLVTGGGAGSGIVATLNGALAAGLVLLGIAALRPGARSGTPPPLFLEFLPLILVPLMYAEIPLLHEASGLPFRDAAVAALEGVLFPSDPSGTLAGPGDPVLASELLHLAYVSFYPLVYLPPLTLLARGRRGALTETVITLMATFIVCFTIFAVLPVAGPRYTGVAPDAPPGPVRDLVRWILEVGSSRGTAFPSSHVAVATVQTVLLLGRHRPTGLALAVLTLGLAGGAVYGGFHYAVDVVAGGALGLGLGILVPRLLRRVGGGPRTVQV